VAAEGTYKSHTDYVDYPLVHLPNTSFDKVLINGKARVACALRILPHLHSNSIVFFHDWFLRPEHYAAVLDYYDEVSRVMATDIVFPSLPAAPANETYGILVLRPKPVSPRDATGVSAVSAFSPDTRQPVVSADTINAIYAVFSAKLSAETQERLVDVSAGSAAKITTGQLSPANSSGVFQYNHAATLSRQTSYHHLVLDCVALPLLVAMYWAVKALFTQVFSSSLSKQHAIPHANVKITAVATSPRSSPRIVKTLMPFFAAIIPGSPTFR
jgi:hypothetical protein